MQPSPTVRIAIVYRTRAGTPPASGCPELEERVAAIGAGIVAED